MVAHCPVSTWLWWRRCTQFSRPARHSTPRPWRAGPPELGSLSNLKDLILHSNELSGEIPAELGNLSNLWSLALNGNQLSGEIPPELGSLSNLSWLMLNGNDLSGEIPPELGSLSNLEHLGLSSFNDLSGCVPGSLEDQLIVFVLGGLPFC